MNKPKPNKWIFIVFAIKTVTGSIGSAAIVLDNKWLGLAVLVLGALAVEAIDFFNLKKPKKTE